MLNAVLQFKRVTVCMPTFLCLVDFVFFIVSVEILWDKFFFFFLKMLVITVVCIPLAVTSGILMAVVFLQLH